MRRALLAAGIALASVFLVGVGPGRPAAGPTPGRGLLEGTWMHTFDDAPDHRQIKVINRTHFVWVTYERNTGRPFVVGGGTYTFDGKVYKETFEFGSRGIPQQLLGKEQSLKVDLAGGEWQLSGTLTNGMRIREVWRRID